MNVPQETQFLREVDQQPQALHDLVNYYRNRGAERLHAWAACARSVKRVTFLGMGTSELTPLLVLRRLSMQGLDASFFDAGDWLHYPHSLKALAVLISQSGESVETRRLAEGPTGDGMIAIVNNEQSTLGRRANVVLPMCAGDEVTISSKTYVNTLAVLHLMAEALTGEAAVAEGLKSLEDLSAVMNTNVDRDSIDAAAGRLCDAGCIFFVSRGPAMVSARQSALTFMEGTQLPAQALTGGAFRHGPFELSDEFHRCVFFIPTGKTTDLLVNMAGEAAKLGTHVVCITDQPHKALKEAGCTILSVPHVPEELFPLAAATTQELLLDAVARKRGLQAGIFRHGQKVTTRE
jgi:glucosamine--fructose-6-phosphate aminotransferase (isomerizing)